MPRSVRESHTKSGYDACQYRRPYKASELLLSLPSYGRHAGKCHEHLADFGSDVREVELSVRCPSRQVQPFTRKPRVRLCGFLADERMGQRCDRGRKTSVINSHHDMNVFLSVL